MCKHTQILEEFFTKGMMYCPDTSGSETMVSMKFCFYYCKKYTNCDAFKNKKIMCLRKQGKTISRKLANELLTKMKKGMLKWT